MLSPGGPGPTAVKARTATVYIVAGSSPVKSTIVFSAPVTVSLVEQSGSVKPDS